MQINLEKYNLRTDLIIEDNKIEQSEIIKGNITINSTYKNGNYYTISFKDITNYEDREKVGKELEKIIKKIIKLNDIKEDDYGLIIGLGNAISTPDSLGVKVIDEVIVTNHLFKINGDLPGMRRISTFKPGVMANTGIESADIIKSLVKEEKPNFIIAIDALAASNIERINKTIQITDTGIHPGSGVGNNRVEISKKTMGIPVIAIGVPTVVPSNVIVYDTLDYLFKHIDYLKENEDTSKLSYYKKNYIEKLKGREVLDIDKERLLGLFGSLNEDDKQELIKEVLNQTELNLIVTPTEIDFLISKLSNLVASSLNNALHRQITHY